MVMVSLTDGEFKAINELLSTGLYGRTQAECCERLIARSLEELTVSGLCDPEPNFPEPGPVEGLPS